ncbi:Oidioi.mRNA.OKI2018_I69.PAR.g9842.t1.cds [Oikopleura dioica]|uniref:Oidioi.mRNA.OKI2018_I69.PAR.g9842.t1.cds n=1 Tax=Oikopleura dioica TaxID=34765 RepID=A0ABN7RNK4_OIKDI|nr:Oidioi.mRNA.OKI2018_I69.PAR.g9842.t1.cds [Oikopleura dioica]
MKFFALFLAVVLGEEVCKFNGIRRRRRGYRAIDYGLGTDLNIVLLRIEEDSLTKLDQSTTDHLKILYGVDEDYETVVTVGKPMNAKYLCCDESIIHVDMIQACQVLDFRTAEVPDSPVTDHDVQVGEEEILMEDIDFKNSTTTSPGNSSESFDVPEAVVDSALITIISPFFNASGYIIILVGFILGVILTLVCVKCCCDGYEREPEIKEDEINSLLLRGGIRGGSFDYRKSLNGTLDRANTLTA